MTIPLYMIPEFPIGTTVRRTAACGSDQRGTVCGGTHERPVIAWRHEWQGIPSAAVETCDAFAVFVDVREPLGAVIVAAIVRQLTARGSRDRGIQLSRIGQTVGVGDIEARRMYERALGMRALRDPDAWERLARAVFDDASLPEPEPEPEPEPAAGPTPGLPGVAALLHWAYLDTAGSDMARDVANTALVSPDAGIAWLLPSGDDTGRLATAIETWRGWLAKVVTDTAPRSGYSEAEMARIRAGLASIALGEVPT